MTKNKIFPGFFIISLVLLMAGCTAAPVAPTSTPTLQPAQDLAFTVTPIFPLPEGAILFEAGSNKNFAGHVHGQGGTAIILANMSTGGEAQWDPLIQALDKQKFTIITFGYLHPDYINATREVGAVLERLREVGYKRVACIGASLGVTGCGSIALGPEMVGMVMIAGPNYGQPVRTSYPKLFIAAADDPWSRDTENAYNASTEPRRLLLYQGTGIHGTGLFHSDHGEQFLQTLLTFANSLP